MDNLEYQESKFEVVDKDEQKVIVGKLKMLESLVEHLNCLRESYTRQLLVCGNNNEEDVFKEENIEEKKRYQGIKGLDGECIETLFDPTTLETIKEV